MKKKRWYNRTLLVNYGLQITILVYSLVLALWVTLANLFFFGLMSGRFGHVLPTTIFVIVPVVMFVIFSTTVFFGMVLTNRIAGPIFRLKSHMDKVANGETYSEMKIREADYFSDLVVPYNRIINKIKESGE